MDFIGNTVLCDETPQLRLQVLRQSVNHPAGRNTCTISSFMRASQHTIMRSNCIEKGYIPTRTPYTQDTNARRRKPPRRAWRSRLQPKCTTTIHLITSHHGTTGFTKTDKAETFGSILFKSADLTVNLASRFVGHKLSKGGVCGDSW